MCVFIKGDSINTKFVFTPDLFIYILMQYKKKLHRNNLPVRVNTENDKFALL